MEVLIAGLNSYLGRRAVGHLNQDDFHVHGIVRDLSLFESSMSETPTATLDKVDLLRKDQAYDSFRIQDGVGLSIYISHVPTLGETVNLNLELITLKNFIELMKVNQCNRLVYIARLMDKPYIHYIESVLVTADVDYTIVLKNLAIGKGSVLDRYMHQLINGRYLAYDHRFAKVKFSPISALDLLRWIYNVNWDREFHRQTIEIGGPTTLTVQDMFRLYKKVLYPNATVKSFKLPRFVMRFIFKKLYHIHQEDLIEFRRVMKREYPIDNRSWKNKILFVFTPLEQVILQDQ